MWLLFSGTISYKCLRFLSVSMQACVDSVWQRKIIKSLLADIVPPASFFYQACLRGNCQQQGFLFETCLALKLIFSPHSLNLHQTLCLFVFFASAFVTLLNGEQAQRAIKEFHQYVLRDREISVQLQPTDALLCIANLPRAFTQQQFEELVRPFGNLERCFLVYSSSTGRSKGYGFVEYMKKDSAARAKSELLGKQLGSRMLYVHWTEVGSLTYPLLHSRCLCVDRLPVSLLTAQDLRHALSDTHIPVFCQVRWTNPPLLLNIFTIINRFWTQCWAFMPFYL